MEKMNNMPLADRIGLSRRYVRSTDLLRDLHDPQALDGYVVTASAKTALERLVSGLAGTSTQRAFRITGPYGSGKSSFALFLCQLLSEGKNASAAELAENAGVSDISSLAPHELLLMSGRRSSFAHDLLELLMERATAFGATKVLKVVEKGLSSNDAGDVATHALKALELFASHVSKENGSRTLVLVDEMGRYVEHAAANPRTEDPSIFQRVAELAGGRAKAPLAVLVLLHHRFAEYVAGLGDWMVAEWTRSAERFEEIAFGDSLEQSLHLIAGALKPISEHDLKVVQSAQSLYRSAGEAGLFSISTTELLRLGPQLYPLHPASLACISLIARRIGQNERSIFGFLQTLEPYGFRRFLEGATYGPTSWYRLPQLFDYLAAQGTLRFGSADRERRWHLALDTIPQAQREGLEGDVLRCVALIAVLEPIPGLAASAKLIAWCLGIDETKVADTLEALVERHLVYRRPQSGDFSLWSRSSVDLDHLLEEAKVRVPVPSRLDNAIAALPTPRPLVAHAHYQRSGTLRAFSVSMRSAIDDQPVTIPPGFDGSVVVLAAHPHDDPHDVRSRAASLSAAAGPEALVNIHDVVPADLECAYRLSLWRWIRDNCAELRVDDLARTEVNARVAQAESELSETFAALTTPGDGDWYQSGTPVHIDSRSALSRRISDTCDQIYYAAPTLRNELINRSKLSSAVASARIRLLEVMLEHSSEAMLGLTGAPPERTIHLSMFQATGMHRQEAEGPWAFLPPPEDDPLRWRPIWDRLAELLAGRAPVGFDQIVEELGKAPWGLRAGPSLLLIAAFMINHRTEVALMERNSFVPELTPAHFMRLAKNPSHFALRFVGGDDKRTEVLERLASGLPLQDGVRRPTAEVKPIVEVLYRWFSTLPENTRTTERISPLAKRVRSALAKARDPMDIVFDQLPRACECIDDQGRIDATNYVDKMVVAMSELDEVDPRLRGLASTALADAFGQRNAHKVREKIQADFNALRAELTDYSLRQFVDRVLSGDEADGRWLDGIAGLLAGRRIENWDDQSIDVFSFKVRELAGRLARWLFLKQRAVSNQTEMLSIHMMTTSGDERAVVVDGGVVDPKSVDIVRRSLEGVESPERVLAALLDELIQLKQGNLKV